MPKGRKVLENEDFQAHEGTIRQLYVSENKPLKKVMSVMAREHDFHRTKAQYESAFKRWGITKKSKAEEWVFIGQRIKEWESQGLPWAVKIRGVQISELKVMKEVRRYGYQTVYERFASERELPIRPKTPPGIVIFAPPNSYSPTSAGVTLQNCCDTSNSSVLTQEQILACANATPWRSFMNFTKTVRLNGSTNFLVVPQFLRPFATEVAFQADVAATGGTNNQLEITGRAEGSRVQELIDTLTEAFYLNLDLQVPLAYNHLELFLPSNEGGSLDIDVMAVLDLSRSNAQLEFLKLVTNLMSNSIETRKFGPIIVELAYDKRNLSLLRSLLDTNLLTVRAFSEKLLVYAAADNNLLLVKTLIEGRIDLDARAEFYGNNMTALEAAINYASDQLVIYLLNSGANRNQKVGQFRRYNSILDCAVEKRNCSIIGEILKSRPQFIHDSPNATILTLCLVLREGKVDTLEVLFNRQPVLLNQAISDPWILFEAAAMSGCIATFDALLTHGLSMEAKNEFGGSPLAIASYYGHIKLVQHLLNMGSDVNSVTIQYKHIGSELTLNWRRLNYSLAYTEGKTALQIALAGSDNEMVQLLLHHADANRSCRDMFPIQTAVYVGNEEGVRILLERDIEVNAVAGNVRDERLLLRHTTNVRDIPWPLSPPPPSPVSHSDVTRPKISGKESVNDIDNKVIGRPAIRIALETGHESIFNMLLEHGAIVNSRDTCINYWDPLKSAITGGNRNLVRRVLREFKIPSRRAPGCLAECIRVYGCEFAEELLYTNAFDPKTDVHQPQVICNAIYQNNRKFVKWLLSHAISTLGQLPPNYGAVAIAFAVDLNNVAMIQIFLEFGVKPYEPLIQDVDTSHLDNCKYMLRKGANAIAKAFESSARESIDLLTKVCKAVEIDKNDEKNRKHALYSAYVTVIQKGNLPMVKKLVEQGVWLDTVYDDQYRQKCSTLQLALSYNQFKVAEYLLSMGANVNGPAYSECLGGLPRDQQYFRTVHTTLQYAALKNRPNLLSLLLERGADVNAPPSFHFGATALQYAAFQGNFKIVSMLLKAGANINAPGSVYEGRTAIEGAAEWGRLDMVKFLLNAGADIRGKFNMNYRKTVYRAWTRGHITLAQMVQQWKAEQYGEKDCDLVVNILAAMKNLKQDCITRDWIVLTYSRGLYSDSQGEDLLCSVRATSNTWVDNVI